MENKKSKYIFIVFSVLCIMMIVLSSVKDGLMNPIRNTIGYMLVPVQTGVNKIGSSLYDNLKERRSLNEVKEENRKLQEKIDVLTEDNNRLNQNQEELGRLRKLYELDQNYLQYDKIAARVIAKDSEKWFQVFRIDKGTKDGIEKGMNVLSNNGLCGVIEEAYYNHSVVRSLIDDRSSVSAMSVNSGDLCFVNGSLEMREDGTLLVEMLTEAPKISEGDEIVTSYISDIYLPGIKIGYITEIPEQNGNIKTAILTPVADFEHLTMVLIITDQKSDILQKESGD